MSPTQDNRPARIETAFGKDVLLLVSASISEELGRPFEITVQLRSETENLDPAAILKTPASITVDLPNGSKRYFHGVVQTFDQKGFKGSAGFCNYTAVIVPEFALLKHTTDCRVFLDKTIPEIVQEVLGEQGIMSDAKTIMDPDITYEKRNFCVQYRESAFDFLSRLLEFAGIYYYFRHSESEHILVFCNSSTSDHPTYPDYESITYNPVDSTGQFICSWESRNSVRSEKYVLRDYDYNEPKTSLLTNSDTTVSKFSRFDCPGGYTVAEGSKGTLEYGSHYAQLRLEEETCRKSIISGSGSVLGIGAGWNFTPLGPMTETVHLTTAMHLSLILPDFSSTGTSSSVMETVCTFEAIPRSISYRPMRLTPKPVIPGLQTAVVVGPADWDNVTDGPFIGNSQIGSVQVQFLWDRYHREGRDQAGEGKVNSSIPVRVSQISAGNGWGSMFIPHPGNEVLVAFEEGDPDRPVIVGSVYNYLNLPPSKLPRGRFLSYINDVGGNAISLTSFKGKQSICIYANYPNDPPGSGYKEFYGFTPKQ
jgi:type VI secretion system secreted protein VgrG